MESDEFVSSLSCWLMIKGCPYHVQVSTFDSTDDPAVPPFKPSCQNDTLWFFSAFLRCERDWRSIMNSLRIKSPILFTVLSSFVLFWWQEHQLNACNGNVYINTAECRLFCFLWWEMSPGHYHSFLTPPSSSSPILPAQSNSRPLFVSPPLPLTGCHAASCPSMTQQLLLGEECNFIVRA